MTEQPQTNPDHYEDCPQYSNPEAPCYCDGIRQADDNYWNEEER